MEENNQKNVLDSTLRYLYNTFRKCEIGVAIEFTHGGRVWRADTPEEAIALRRRLEADSASEGSVKWGVELNWVWTPDLVMDLLKEAGPKQLAFLEALHEKETVTDRELMERGAYFVPMALAGVLSGLSKQLKKMGLKPWDLYRVEVNWTGKEKTRTFRLSSEFRSVASEIGWPENWKKRDDVNTRTTK